MTTKTKPTDPYAKAGVNIEKGNELVHAIKTSVNKTHDRRVLGGIGGFAGLFELGSKYKNPVLVGCTDGVGTKVALSQAHDKTHLTGQDLVAMCVNDLIVQGAEPLFFLDYYATGKLDVDVAVEVVSGIGKGCELSGCALIGGETAEMPGMYHGSDYDVAGFCVGVVEAEDAIDGSQVAAGDALIALGSSGPHSNGFSLIRKIIEVSGADITEQLGSSSIQEQLLTPTRIYVKSVLSLLETVKVNAISHITGGGFWENIPRVLPDTMQANIDKSSWQWPDIFNWLQSQGNVTEHEMYRTFNCGVGLIIALPQDSVNQALSILNDAGENAWVIGEVADKSGTESVVIA